MDALGTMTNILIALGAPAILSGAVIAWLSRRMARLDSREERRREEAVLILKGLLTIGGLAGATAGALKDGQCNGGVTAALEEYRQYRDSLSAYLVGQAAEK